MKRACKFGIEFNSRFRPAVAGGLIVFGNIRDYGGFGRYFSLPKLSLPLLRQGWPLCLFPCPGVWNNSNRRAGARRPTNILSYCCLSSNICFSFENRRFFSASVGWIPGESFNEAKACRWSSVRCSGIYTMTLINSSPRPPFRSGRPLPRIRSTLPG